MYHNLGGLYQQYTFITHKSLRNYFTNLQNIRAIVRQGTIDRFRFKY
jgi:hypothetical protein